MSSIPACRALVAERLSLWLTCLLFVAGLGSLGAVTAVPHSYRSGRSETAESHQPEAIPAVPSAASELEFWGLVR